MPQTPSQGSTIPGLRVIGSGPIRLFGEQKRWQAAIERAQQILPPAEVEEPEQPTRVPTEAGGSLVEDALAVVDTGLSESGLPRRRPRASLVPGSARPSSKPVSFGSDADPSEPSESNTSGDAGSSADDEGIRPSNPPVLEDDNTAGQVVDQEHGIKGERSGGDLALTTSERRGELFPPRPRDPVFASGSSTHRTDIASVETPDRQGAVATTGVADKIDKDWESRDITEIADAPVEALRGVSEADAQHLKDAFNIKTVRDLGTNQYFLWAQGIAKLAE